MAASGLRHTLLAVQEGGMTASIHHITAANTSLLDNVGPDVFDHAIDRRYLAAYVADPRHALFVAVENGAVAGHIRGNVHLQPDRAPDLYIDNLGTTPAHQRRGIAAGLMDALIAWGKTQGCTYAWVATEIDNDGAKGFYAAQRFMHDSIAMFALEFD
jgi:ribosomal protein S18 acetylase RimI-like enzyme